MIKEKYNPYNPDGEIWGNKLVYLSKLGLLKEKNRYKKFKKNIIYKKLKAPKII